MNEKEFLLKVKDYLEEVLPEGLIKDHVISDSNKPGNIYYTLIIYTGKTSIYISYNLLDNYSLLPDQHYLLRVKQYSGKLMYVIDYVDPPTEQKSVSEIMNKILDIVPNLEIPIKEKEVVLPTVAFKKFLNKYFNTKASNVYVFEPTYIRPRASAGLDTNVLLYKDSIYDTTLVPICDYGKNKKEKWSRISTYIVVYTNRETKEKSIRYLMKDLESFEYFPSSLLVNNVSMGDHKSLLIGSFLDIPRYFPEYCPICAELIEKISTYNET